MLQKIQGITISDFNEGLNTGANFLKGKVNQSPDCMDIKWNLDSTIQKRLGSSTTNTVALQSTSGWGMFDFGATSLRWLVVANGTGISASSNGGATFVSVNTSRTQTFQQFERSKNICVATSFNRDDTLYWAGSAGTQFEILAPNSAPSAKYSINFNAFLVLLNVADSNGLVKKRGFYYADEAFQLTSSWVGDDSNHTSGFFEFPSEGDDEITEKFIISKRLYISTKDKLFRVTFVGGNPDWSYLEIKGWGFVPGTAKKVTTSSGEVIIGMDNNRRLRIFDGVDDVFGSGNIEKNNKMSEFYMENISLAGSGVLVSNAEFDHNEQEYRLNVVIGKDSSETTHCIIFNGRNNAFYPYSNQKFQSMAMMESGGKEFLMGCDRVGRVHILNSGNQDVDTAINEHYDSPILFRKTPGEVSKGKKIDFYLQPTSSGNLYFQSRADFNSVYSSMKLIGDIQQNTSTTQLIHSVDTPSVHNALQFRITSSDGTADPWLMTRADFLQSGLGAGKGGA